LKFLNLKIATVGTHNSSSQEFSGLVSSAKLRQFLALLCNFSPKNRQNLQKNGSLMSYALIMSIK